MKTATPTVIAPQLEVYAEPPRQFAGTHVNILVIWYGGAAKLRIVPPEGRWGCWEQDVCSTMAWDVEGPASRSVRLYIFSTWKPGEEFVVTIRAEGAGGNPLTSGQVSVTILGAGATVTPTNTPQYTPTPTGTPQAALIVEPRQIVTLENPTGARWLWLRLRQAVGGNIWAYVADQVLDIETAGMGWRCYETSGFVEIYLWFDTNYPAEVLGWVFTDENWYGGLGL